MKRLCIAALLAGTSLGAHALGRLADVSIIDSETGAVLTPHYFQGEYWIAGAPGARYAIQIRNRLGAVSYTHLKKLVAALKEAKLKVDAQIQGDKLRVSSKKRDDLQLAIALLRKAEVELPLQFENFRD